MSKKPGSRRWRAEQKNYSIVTDARSGTGSRAVYGNLDHYEALLTGLFQNPNFLYNTAERTSVLSACILRIAKDVAKSELYLTKRVPDNRFVPFKSAKRYNHPLAKPNQADTQYSFLFKLLLGLETEGKVYIIRLTEGRGQDRKNSYYAFQGRYVNTKRKNEGYVYEILIGDKAVEIDPEDVCLIQIPGFSNNGNSSYSPVRASLEEVLLYRSILQHQNNFAKNGMMAKGFLQIAEGRMSPEARKQLSRDFTDRTSGLSAAETVTLPPGVEYVPVQQNAQESATLELAGWAEEAVLKVFGIPKSVFSQEFASYAAADVQLADYYKNCILPLYKLIEDALNEWPGITGNNEWFQFDKKNLESAEAKKLQGEAKEAHTRAAVNMQALGVYSANEIREAAGDEPLVDENGELHPLAEANPVTDPDAFEEQSPADAPQEDPKDQPEDPQNKKSISKNFYHKTLLSEIEDEVGGED